MDIIGLCIFLATLMILGVALFIAHRTDQITNAEDALERLKRDVSDPNVIVVIYGPPGSGKSTLARKLAAERGTYAECGQAQLQGNLHRVLADSPATLILDVDSWTYPLYERLKPFAIYRHISTGKQANLIPTPSVIICSQRVLPIADARRYRFFDIREFKHVQA